MTPKQILKIYHKIGLDNNVRDSFIKEIIEAPYKFTKEKVNALKLREIESEEELNELKTNFGYVYLGKLYTDYFQVLKLKRRKQRWEQKISQKKK